MVGCEASPDAGYGGQASEFGSRSGLGPGSFAGGSLDDAEERADGQLQARASPFLDVLPGPLVDPDLAPLAAFALADEDRSASWFEVGLAQDECFVDPQTGAPQDHDQRADSVAVKTGAGGPHHGDDLLDPGRVGRVAPSFVARDEPATVAGERGRRSTTACSIEQLDRYRDLSGEPRRATATRDAASFGSVGTQRYKRFMAVSIEQFSFELTAGALAEQERALNALRSRAGTIIAAASISGSFLGAKVSHGSLDAWAILALIAFILCLGSAIWVLLPHSLVFAFRGEALLGISDQQGVEDVAQAYRAAGIWIEPYLDANRDTIGQLSAWFTASCVLLAAEVIFWTISVAG